MSPTWAGLYCALWTPTDQDGRLLERALEQNVAFLKTRGIDGLLVLGSTGEFLRLEPAQRRAVMEKAAQIASPLRLMFNISELRPAAVAELGRYAHELGSAAVSLLPPYFFPLAQDDLVEFFVRAADASRLPLFLYNFPERTGNRISLETIAAVADRVPVAGVKQSGSEFTYHAELVKLGREKGFVVLTGADTRLPEAAALGVSGCVSGLSNAVPELVAEALAGALKAGGTLRQSAAQRMIELGRRIQTVHFPLDVAACMEARALQVGSPKTAQAASTRAKYQALVNELRDLFREWNLSAAMPS